MSDKLVQVRRAKSQGRNPRSFSDIFRRWVKRSAVSGQILALLIVVAIFAIATKGKFLSWPNIQVILGLAAIPAIIALGLHQTIVLGGIDLSVEGVVALCVIFVGLLMRNPVNSDNVGLWIFPIVAAVGGLAGTLNGVLHTKLKIPSFISTLGMSWTLYGLAVYISNGQTTPILDSRLQPVVSGQIIGIPIIAIVALILILLLQFIQDRTGFGRYLYAIGGDEIVAKQAGVKVDGTKISVFVYRRRVLWIGGTVSCDPLRQLAGDHRQQSAVPCSHCGFSRRGSPDGWHRWR